MRLKTITFDLWGTILQPNDPQAKIERRLEMLAEVLREAGADPDPSALRRAYWAVDATLEARVGRDPHLTPAACWALLAKRLGLLPDAVPYARCAAAYEELTLEFLPALEPGIAAALAELGTRYQLGLICNTLYTGGRVLRELLARLGLYDAFQTLVFSDEVGHVKPQPAIFHHSLHLLGARPGEVLHVGDSEALDIQGALAAGTRAARYRPRGSDPSRADLVVERWDTFAAQVA